MQFIVVSEQLKIMLFAVVFGCIFGLIYDIIKVGRILCAYNGNNLFAKRLNGAVFVHLADIIFFLFLSISFCIFLFYFNNGKFRWYFVFSMLLGAVCYKYSIGVLIEKLSCYIVGLIRVSIRLLLVKPLFFLLYLLKLTFSPLKSGILFCYGLRVLKREKLRYLKEFEV